MGGKGSSPDHMRAKTWWRLDCGTKRCERGPKQSCTPAPRKHEELVIGAFSKEIIDPFSMNNNCSIEEHLPGRRIIERSGLYGQSSQQPVEWRKKLNTQRSKDMLLTFRLGSPEECRCVSAV